MEARPAVDGPVTWSLGTLEMSTSDAATMTRLGQLEIAQLWGEGRTRRFAPDRNSTRDPSGLLWIQREGTATLSRPASEVCVVAGSMVVLGADFECMAHLASRSRSTVLRFSWESLGLPADSGEVMAGRVIEAGSGAALVLTQVLESCLALKREPLEAASTEVTTVVGDLLAAVLRAAWPEGVHEHDMLRRRILEYVRAGLRDPDLSHASVAAAHHLSVRSLHRLFENEPTTVADSIRGMRLEAVKRDLSDPRCNARSVMFLASQWGFRDQAHFTRCFRERYGVTPARFRRVNAKSQPACR